MNWNEIFDYKEGKLYWKISLRNGIKIGSEAGTKSKKKEDYVTIAFKYKMHQAHRIIWEMINGSIPTGMEIDHINGIRNDNRLENLRVVFHRKNQQNRIEHRNGRLCGCYYYTEENKWLSQIQIDGKRIYIGRFKTEKEAHDAYLKYSEEN